MRTVFGAPAPSRRRSRTTSVLALAACLAASTRCDAFVAVDRRASVAAIGWTRDRGLETAERRKAARPWRSARKMAAAESVERPPAIAQRDVRGLRAAATKAAMCSFIASMCVTLPISVSVVKLLEKCGAIDTTRREKLSLRAGKFWARWLMRILPFASVDVVVPEETAPEELQEPTIWVCNHISMLDIFMLMAQDKKVRGKKARPLKIIYWKTLENNPVNKLFFKACGFIPVEMEDNKDGDNSYNMSSFKTLLKMSKKAFEDGFDIGILPEGQLNPTPEKGLRPIFSGAFTLAKMSRRPIRMMALSGTQNLWHADDAIGMDVRSRKVKVRRYPSGRKFSSSEEFAETFKNVVGEFGATGNDLPDNELNAWIDGSRWAEIQAKNTEENLAPA